MSPEVLSQASYSTILTIAFDLRHKLEYLTFGNRERYLFYFRFLDVLYGERCICKWCGANGAAHVPIESDQVNLSGYLMEWGVVAHIKGKCVCCHAPFSHYSCTPSEVTKLNPKLKIHGIELKYYGQKANHQSILYNMMELVTLETIDDDKPRQDAFQAISSFMSLSVKRVSELWCKPEYYQIRKDKFERWKRETLLTPGHHPIVPPQAYRTYIELYELLTRAFVENRVAVASALDLLQYALVDNPSRKNFLMLLSASLMYVNRFQEFIRLNDPQEYMIPSDPLYQQVKHRFISSDLSIVRRLLVVIMLYEMPQFYYYVDFLRAASGDKEVLTHAGVDLCRCLVKQGRILENDKLKRSKKGKDDLMRQQLRIKNIRIGQTELDDIPRQFVRYFAQREHAPNLLLALKALNLEEKVQQIEVYQPRGTPPAIVIDLARLPRKVLLPVEKVQYPELTQVMKIQEEAIWYRIDKYIQILKRKKNRNREDLFEFDEEFYDIDIDPKILKKFEQLDMKEMGVYDDEDEDVNSEDKDSGSVEGSTKDETTGKQDTGEGKSRSTKRDTAPVVKEEQNHVDDTSGTSNHSPKDTSVEPSDLSEKPSEPSGEPPEPSEPSGEPLEPSGKLSGEPSEKPSEPSVDPSEPSVKPSKKPSVEPSEKPLIEPSEKPSVDSSEKPSVEPPETSVEPLEPSVEPSELPVKPSEPLEEPSRESPTEPSGTASKEPLENVPIEPPIETSEPLIEPSSQPSKGSSEQPFDEGQNVVGTPPDEKQNVAGIPSDESKNVVGTPSDESKNVAGTPSDESKIVAGTPSDESKIVAGNLTKPGSQETESIVDIDDSSKKEKVTVTSSEQSKVVSEEAKKTGQTEHSEKEGLLLGGPSSSTERRQQQGPSSSSRCCAYCGGVGEKLLRCKRCKQAFYCNANCQRSHWKVHKQQCNAPK